MVVELILPLISQHWPLALVLLLVVYLADNYFHHRLNKYPGPFLAALTDWWRFVDVCRRSPHITHIALHRKHGDIVRLGPNYVSFADPMAIKQIYGLNKGFVKVGSTDLATSIHTITNLL
jgi:hypothetical protein